MKWRRDKARGRDVIDIRGSSPSGGGGLGGGRLPIPTGMTGIGGGLGLIIAIVVIAIQIFGGGGGSGGGFSIDDIFGTGVQAPQAGPGQGIPESEDPQAELFDFSDYVFNDAQDTWDELFSKSGESYERAKLVVYRNGVRTGGCGSASSAVGPFYCPADQRVYLDLSFFGDMERQLNAPGDFAWAYVISHEVGHHVQNLQGTNEAVRREQQANPDAANELSVRLELQADCYAGVWGSTVYEEGALEPGDLEEAFTASEAVGDDRLQQQAGQEVNPDSFTHGTSEQRHRWFQTGYESGDPASCDTFSVEDV